MPRIARQRSETGVYHAMVRGINRHDIFLSVEDKQRYLELLAKVKERSACKIYAYCLMTNHVHLLLHEGNESISETMKRLGSAYAHWYNAKYQRVGHLFQDRFLSEPVETDSYLLAAARYVHQNPVKARLVTDCSHYVWSSYLAYTTKCEHPQGLTDIGVIMEAMGETQFVAFHQELGTDEFDDVEDHVRSPDSIIVQAATNLLKGEPYTILNTLEIQARNRVLRELKALPGVSERQIARVVGVSKSMVRRA